MRSMINKFTGLIYINTTAKDFLLETDSHTDRHTYKCVRAADKTECEKNNKFSTK